MDLASFVLDESLTALQNSFDTQKWANNFGVELVSNQIEIVDTMCHPDIKYMVVLGSRSMGKTYAVATGAIRLCLENAGYGVIVFGPKSEQAIRIVTEITKICKLSYLKSEVDWDRSSRSKMYFNNASSIIALSASELSEIEGWHGDLGILDECFEEDTLIDLADGSKKKIGEIVKEAKPIEVMSYDFETNKVVPSLVTDFKQIPLQKEMVEIEMKDGRKVRCTIDHKFFTQKGWIKAEDLTFNDNILRHWDNRVFRLRVSLVKRIQTNNKFVYDLTVDKHHCYFANGLLAHNCHRISNLVFRQRIIPMFSSSNKPKIIKLGIPAYKNHLFESYNSPLWTKLVYDWTVCPWLYRGGTVEIDNVKYPKSVLESMPLSLKIKKFPNNPELHYPSISGMSEEDFATQYEMKWVEDINLFLKEEDQEKLFGDHEYLTEGKPFETYYFGLDFAGGSEVILGKSRDYTQLVIGRKTSDNVKEIVNVAEFQGDTTVQISEILQLIHPEYGRFKCVGGCADYSSLGTAIVDYFKKMNIPITGIRYKATETTTGKNYKNSIFDQTLFEIRADRLKYPSQYYIEKNAILKKHINEWFALEYRRQPGINSQISAPNDDHDDCPNGCSLMVWAMDRGDNQPLNQNSNKIKKYQFPNLVLGNTTQMNKSANSMPRSPFNK